MNAILNTEKQATRREFIMIGFVLAWVLSMIALPIARWVMGDAAISWGVIITVVFQVAAVFVVLLGAWGVQRTLIALLIVAAATWLAETIGYRTGIPFGHYYYTDLLQPQLAGVPLFIPLAWFMMLPPAWAAAQVIVGTERRWLFVAVSALALTAWDLFLDPQKVAWGFWVWTDGSGGLFEGGYFGVPWQNYLGWLLVASIVTALIRPDRLPVRPLLLIYGIVWVFQTIGQAVFWGQPGPALVGFVGMGLIMLFVWWRWDRAEAV